MPAALLEHFTAVLTIVQRKATHGRPESSGPLSSSTRGPEGPGDASNATPAHAVPAPAVSGDGAIVRVELTPLDKLELAMLEFPASEGVVARKRRVPTPEEVNEFLIERARLEDPSVANIDDAMSHWDMMAKEAGYPDLQLFMRFHAGYKTETYVPGRGHSIEGAGELLPGARDKRYDGVAARMVELKAQYLSEGRSEVVAAELARKTAVIESKNPEWKDRLREEHFRITESDQSCSCRFTGGEELEAIARSSRPDAFSEFNLPGNVSETEQVRNLRVFFEEYRASERLFDNGGKNDVHCGESRARVVNLLTAKGFDVIPILTWRIAFGDAKTDSRYTSAIIKAMRELNLPPAKLLGLIQQLGWKPSMSSEEFVKSSQSYHGTTSEAAGRVYDYYRGLELAERELVGSRIGEEHNVAAVRIGERYYLIDIDGQQFGRTYDRLLIIPEKEAVENGLIIEGSLRDYRSTLDFHGRMIGLNSEVDAEQRVIREYMRTRLGRGPSGASNVGSGSNSESTPAATAPPTTKAGGDDYIGRDLRLSSGWQVFGGPAVPKINFPLNRNHQ
jgi:hypothetical protein